MAVDQTGASWCNMVMSDEEFLKELQEQMDQLEEIIKPKNDDAMDAMRHGILASGIKALEVSENQRSHRRKQRAKAYSSLQSKEEIKGGKKMKLFVREAKTGTVHGRYQVIKPGYISQAEANFINQAIYNAETTNKSGDVCELSYIPGTNRVESIANYGHITFGSAAIVNGEFARLREEVRMLKSELEMPCEPCVSKYELDDVEAELKAAKEALEDMTQLRDEYRDKMFELQCELESQIPYVDKLKAMSRAQLEATAKCYGIAVYYVDGTVSRTKSNSKLIKDILKEEKALDNIE